jgi:hypothetical protein
MVTSQTCDIRGPGAKKAAFLTVAPVYPLRELNPNLTLGDIARSAYLAHVSASQFSHEVHVVDLRFEVAVEKSIVAERIALAGFATAEERVAFSKKLGEYRRRGAFDELIERDLLKPLEELFYESIAADDVYEIRVFAEPSISRAESVRLIIVCESAADVAVIRSIVGAWYDGIRESGTELNLLPLIVDTIDKVTIERVRGSVPIYFRKLSSEAPEA